MERYEEIEKSLKRSIAAVSGAVLPAASMNISWSRKAIKLRASLMKRLHADGKAVSGTEET